MIGQQSYLATEQSEWGVRDKASLSNALEMREALTSKPRRIFKPPQNENDVQQQQQQQQQQQFFVDQVTGSRRGDEHLQQQQQQQQYVVDQVTGSRKGEEAEGKQNLHPELQVGGQTVRNLTRQVLKVIENIKLKEKDSKFSKVTSELENLVMKQTTQGRLARSKATPYPINLNNNNNNNNNNNPTATFAAQSSPVNVATGPSSTGLLGIKDRFKTELCRKFMEDTTCPYGKKCQFAHGYHELRPINRHPRYRTELCREFFTHGLCTYGSRCNFIHVSPDQQLAHQNTDGKAEHGKAVYSMIHQQLQQQQQNLPQPQQQPSQNQIQQQLQQRQYQQTGELFDRPYTPEQDSGLCLSSISPISATLSPIADCAAVDAVFNFDVVERRVFGATATATAALASAAAAAAEPAVDKPLFTSERNSLYSRI